MRKKGFKHSEETKVKLRLSKLGELNPMYKKSAWNRGNHTYLGGGTPKGFKQSQETIEKKRIARTGMKLSEEAKEKLSIHFTGKKRPEISGERNSMWKGGLPKCTICNSQLSTYKAKFCIFHRSAGINSGNWKGGEETAKERAVVSQHNREARKRDNGGTYTVNEWENLIRDCHYMCLCCKRQEPEVKLTADHIIPVSKGGRNEISNIQPLCKSCNSRKFVKRIDYISGFYQVTQITT